MALSDYAGSGNLVWRGLTLFTAIALALSAGQPCGAQPAPSGPDKADAPPAVHHPVTQEPKEIEAALLAADPGEAARLLWRFSCANYGNDDSVEVVRRAWARRASGSATGATRNPLVRTLMAKCLAEYKPRFAPSAPEDAPVLAQLRLAIDSTNPDEVEAAVFGLTQTATARDVQSIVAAATRLPAVAVTLSSDLWQICRVDATEGARTIAATVKDARQRASMEANKEHLIATQRLLCEFDANIVGKAVSQADIDQFWGSAPPGPRPSADELRNALQSTNVSEAREVLKRQSCLASERDGMALIQSAWRTRDSGPAESVMRKPEFRLAVAVCLAKAAAASTGTTDPSVMELLRQVVGSSDPRTLFAGLEGLSRVATAADLLLIESSVKGRSSVFATVAVGHLTRSCAPGAQQAAEAIREGTSSLQGLRAIEYEIGSTYRVREFVCAARKGGGK
jgi:hypothetical protein